LNSSYRQIFSLFFGLWFYLTFYWLCGYFRLGRLFLHGFLGCLFLDDIFRRLHGKNVSSKVVVAAKRIVLYRLFRQRRLLRHQDAFFVALPFQHGPTNRFVSRDLGLVIFYLLFIDFVHFFHDGFDELIGGFAQGVVGYQIVRADAFHSGQRIPKAVLGQGVPNTRFTRRPTLRIPG
jgi:hypothetical protein